MAVGNKAVETAASSPAASSSSGSSPAPSAKTPAVKQAGDEDKPNNNNEETKSSAPQVVPARGSVFKTLTGYEARSFRSLAAFSQWLERPVDGSALGVFRMLYGVAMLIDIAEERGGSQMDVRFGEPQHCHFPLFDGIRALSFPAMGWLYLAMWLGALGIALGYRFRYSCLAYVLPYWYIFLLDKPTWNNHSYLFGLVGTLLLFTQANRCCSVDSWMQPSLPRTVPYWNYFLIKFQFFVLYMYAGLKKFTAEWLSGYSMSTLSRHWVFAPFRSVLTTEMIDLLVVHWFTAVFDFSIAFLMTCEKTRLAATPFMLSFHLMNSRLFVIGMFPWVCLAEVPLFFGFDWPRRLKAYICRRCKSSAKTPAPSSRKPHLASPELPVGWKAKARATLILLWCALQLFLPYSHFITKGYNNWTNGLYGYSWDMMVHTYDTILTSIKIVDNNSGRVHFLNPYAFTEYDRWTKYADMAVQYAKCIEANIRDDYARNPAASPLSAPVNFSVYFDIWCSMNGRFQQRVFDPRVDLLRAEWSPFESTAWSMPLLDELNHMRPKLKTITNEVLNWNNYSDVIFVADFPGLTLDNFIAAELTNVTLTILEGNVRYQADDEPEAYFLTAGKSIGLSSGHTHHVSTIGLRPSCYLYTYINQTMLETGTVIEEIEQQRYDAKPKLPLWAEFRERLHNYKQFLGHVGNCVLYTLYDVPIPMAVRERN